MTTTREDQCTHIGCWCMDTTLPRVGSYWVKKLDKHVLYIIVSRYNHQSLRATTTSSYEMSSCTIYHTGYTIGVNTSLLTSFLEKYEPYRIDDV